MRRINPNGNMTEAFSEPEGLNFATEDELPAADVARALCLVAGFLQAAEPWGAPLQRYDDWWEHDGLQFDAGPITFHDLFESVQSPRALLTNAPGDDYVFVGIMPEHGRWYLRFRVAWDTDGFEITGRFDITLPYALAEQFRGEVASQLGVRLTETDAREHYRRIRM